MVILAHISAPAKKSDDDDAREQHQSYVRFQPARRITYSRSTAVSKKRKIHELVGGDPHSTSIERLEDAQKLWKTKKPQTCLNTNAAVTSSTQDAMMLLVDAVKSQPNSSPAPSQTLAPSLSSLPRMLMSPPPTKAVLEREGTGTFMSQTLQKFLSLPELAKRYKPESVMREVKASERGYWQIDTSSWTSLRQFDFWTFLHHLVKNGRAGFGTMCIYDSNQNDKLGVVRIYCWGEIHKPVWIMCALGTKGSSWLRGTKWISAIDGKEVIVF